MPLDGWLWLPLGLPLTLTHTLADRLLLARRADRCASHRLLELQLEWQPGWLRLSLRSKCGAQSRMPRNQCQAACGRTTSQPNCV
jgi:hypothetical protein